MMRGESYIRLIQKKPRSCAGRWAPPRRPRRLRRGRPGERRIPAFRWNDKKVCRSGANGGESQNVGCTILIVTGLGKCTKSSSKWRDILPTESYRIGVRY